MSYISSTTNCGVSFARYQHTRAVRKKNVPGTSRGPAWILYVTRTASVLSEFVGDNGVCNDHRRTGVGYLCGNIAALERLVVDETPPESENPSIEFWPAFRARRA